METDTEQKVETPAISQENQQKIDAIKASVIETAKKGAGAKPVEAPADTNDYKAELDTIYANPILKSLIDYTKTGKSLDEVFSFKPSAPVDLSNVPSKDLFVQDPLFQKLTAEEKTAELARFDALSPIQKEREVQAIRESLKSKTAEMPDILKTINEGIAKDLPRITENKKQESQRVQSYLGILNRDIPALKNVEGKEYSKEVQQEIMIMAQRISSREDLTPESAKKNIELAHKVVCSDEIFLSGVAIGAEEALKKYFAPNADTSHSSVQTGAAKEEKGHLYPKEMTEALNKKQKFGKKEL